MGGDYSRWARRSLVLAFVLVLSAPAQARTQAPGAPGATPNWAAADKHGFGTSATRASKVWFTLRQTSLTEVYYPDLSHPSTRDLRFAVDGRDESHATGSVEQTGLTYVQTVSTAHWKLTKTYVTDPARATVLIKVHFETKDRHAHALSVRYDPSLDGDGRDDVAWTRGHALLAHDPKTASALVARPAFAAGSSGYAGDDANLLHHRYDALRRGNVVQAARTFLTGRGSHRDVTLALGFGRRASLALTAARASLDAGFDAVAAKYAQGWTAYRARLSPAPAAAAPVAHAYETSLLVLKALEDKANPGALVASPTHPWGRTYDRVRARDLYQDATAELAAGDRQAAGRALDFLLRRLRRDDGSIAPAARVDGHAPATGTPLDVTALPLVLAWQLNRFDAATWRRARKAADYVVAHGPASVDRWGGPTGYSPATIAADVAGLVCAADLAVRNGDGTRASTYTRVADEWAANVERWTATTNGPYSPRPYYLRLTTDQKPDQASTYAIGTSGPAAADQRGVVDPGALELVRLGVRPAGDKTIADTVAVVDAKLAAGAYWHRFSHDDYGEQDGGGPYRPDSTLTTLGRAWPLLTGERGEYELLAGHPATAQLTALAGAANDGGMLPEQVWDGRGPSALPGGGTGSATPLGWTHAQLIRLVWSIAAGRPVERPGIVACRYANACG
jgi:glucoamylase